VFYCDVDNRFLFDDIFCDRIFYSYANLLCGDWTVVL
jgi:hypothetical protein